MGRPLDGDVELKIITHAEKTQSHDRHLVAFCVEGEGVVVIEGVAIDIQQGDSATVPPDTDYYITSYGDDTHCTVMVAYY